MVFVPERGSSRIDFIGADEGRFDTFPAKLINELFELGVDVQVAQPDFRNIFTIGTRQDNADICIRLPGDRVHLAEDRAIFYSKPLNANSDWENIKISFAFQREVINQIAPGSNRI